MMTPEELEAHAEEMRMRSPLAKKPGPRRLACLPERVQTAVLAASEECNIETSKILGPRSSADAVRARNLAVRALRMMGMSLPEIGRVFGRHHTTILHSLSGEIDSAAFSRVWGRLNGHTLSRKHYPVHPALVDRIAALESEVSILRRQLEMLSPRRPECAA